MNTFPVYKLPLDRRRDGRRYTPDSAGQLLDIVEVDLGEMQKRLSDNAEGENEATCDRKLRKKKKKKKKPAAAAASQEAISNQ